MKSTQQTIEPLRVALRPREAAEALGISERKLRDLLPELPHLRLGGVVLIPITELKDWLAERAKTAVAESKTADEILSSLKRRRP
ncbi:MAG: helix-turn-helix domain-containing protein [Myxococcales bacterium]|nr:helix-turn-helix domain-containing protein [Myxococcales bacterium]